MTLGELIEALGGYTRQDQAIRLSTGGVPGRFISYRGYYEDLALEDGTSYRDDIPAHMIERGYRKNDTVADVLEAARAALGANFGGYKGGTYTMHEGTRLWIANEGDSSGIALMDVQVHPDQVVIVGTDLGEYS